MAQELSLRIKNPCELVRKCIQAKNYRFSNHAIQRGLERSISYQAAVYVLKNGSHNEKKTSFDRRRQIWKYAIEGKTFDGIYARVIVAFKKEMIIITVIRLLEKK